MVWSFHFRVIRFAVVPRTQMISIFWGQTPKAKPFSNQNKGQLGSRIVLGFGWGPQPWGPTVGPEVWHSGSDRSSRLGPNGACTEIIFCQAILCDLFGMVKWPFQMLSDLQLGDQKVTLTHLVDTFCFQMLESCCKTSWLRGLIHFPLKGTWDPNIRHSYWSFFRARGDDCCWEWELSIYLPLAHWGQSAFEPKLEVGYLRCQSPKFPQKIPLNISKHTWP